MKTDKRKIFLIWIVGGVITMALFVKAIMNDTSQSAVQRNGVNGEEKQISLMLESDGKKEENKLIVASLELSKKEADEQAEKCFAYLDSVYLDNNTDADHVCENLYLPDQVEQYPFFISWSSSDSEQIAEDGKVVPLEKKKRAVCVVLKTVLSYKNWEWSHEYPVCVVPKELSAWEKKKQEVMEALAVMEKDTRMDAWFQIPSQMEGVRIKTVGVADRRWVGAAVLTVAVGLGIPLAEKEKEKKEKERKKKALTYIYPSFVNKLMLFVGAGMTFRLAIEKISSEMTHKKEERILQKELIRTVWEMENGISEIEAYYQFGRRTENTLYIKLATLMIQNITKGAKGFSVLLEQEEELAQQNRKIYAKKEGELAGTKLLFPMCILLFVVMGILMIPAFMNFQIV